MTTRRTSTVLALALLLPVTLVPDGCLMGSPSAAVSGEPYGWTVEDVRCLQGDRRSVWKNHTVLAAIDLPFAAVLDTAFLPIALIFWGLSAAFGGDDHGHGDDEDPEAPHSHGDGYEHRHDEGETPHEHDE